MSRWHWVLLAACVVAAAVGLSAGPSGWMAPWSAIAKWAEGDVIVASLRAPRVGLAALVGASLGLAGALMQALLRNDLADPYVLGLSGGASVGAVVSLLLVPALPPGFLAALGAAGAALLVRGLAAGPYDRTRLLLAGVTLSSLFTSLTGLLIILAPEERLLRSAYFWLFGGMGTPEAKILILPAVLLAAALVLVIARAERLDRLTLGDDVATSLGVNVPKARRFALVIAVLLTASAVAVGGLVGFVGLIAPHAARRLVGVPHRAMLPATAMLGAALVMAADTAARTAFAPRELPVGLVTAGLGGPFFLHLLRRER
ncbi:MAG: iron ABC transporter permease [Polyangiaceae bacterium]